MAAVTEQIRAIVSYLRPHPPLFIIAGIEPITYLDAGALPPEKFCDELDKQITQKDSQVGKDLPLPPLAPCVWYKRGPAPVSITEIISLDHTHTTLILEDNHPSIYHLIYNLPTRLGTRPRIHTITMPDTTTGGDCCGDTCSCASTKSECSCGSSCVCKVSDCAPPSERLMHTTQGTQRYHQYCMANNQDWIEEGV